MVKGLKPSRNSVEKTFFFFIPSKGGLFKLLAPIQRVTKLQESAIIFCNLINEMASCVYLTKSQFVMVLVVQDVHQIRVEGVDIL